MSAEALDAQPEVVSIRSFAKAVGTTDTTIRKYLAKNKIPEAAVARDTTGEIIGLHYAQALQAYHEAKGLTAPGVPITAQDAARAGATLQPGELQPPQPKVRPGERGGWLRSGPEPKPDEAAPSDIPTDLGGFDGMTGNQIALIESKVKARQEIVKLEKLETEAAILRGDLVRRADVDRALFVAGQELRNAVETIPDRFIDLIIAAADDRAQAHQILTEALGDFLNRAADLPNRELTTERTAKRAAAAR